MQVIAPYPGLEPWLWDAIVDQEPKDGMVALQARGQIHAPFSSI